MAQRLVRKICQKCGEPFDEDQIKRKALGIDPKAKVFRGKGCKSCNMSGYSGRIGIYELVMLTSPIRELILQGASEEKLLAEAKKGGTLEVRESGKKKILEGITTIEEVLRVTEE